MPKLPASVTQTTFHFHFAFFVFDIAAIFFILLFFAAITSSISLIEPAITYMIENNSITRSEASIKLGAITWLLGIGTILSFSYAADLKVF